MKTVKTTLIVVATLVAVYFVYDFLSGSYASTETASAEGQALTNQMDRRTALMDLGEQYRGKPVTIGGSNGVPFWQVYQYNKVGTLQRGDRVTLLDVDVYSPDGYNAKVKRSDGFEGFVSVSHIKELNK